MELDAILAGCERQEIIGVGEEERRQKKKKRKGFK